MKQRKEVTKMKKKTIITLAIVTVMGLGLLGSSSAFAQSKMDGQDHMSSLAQKIAEKFGLNQVDVQAVFDEEHETRKAGMKANFEDQLSQYVTDGKITEAQKQLILQKRSELDTAREAKRESSKNLTPEERKSQMEAERTSLEAWAEENGIEIQYLMSQGRKGHGTRGFGGHEDRL